MPCCEDCPCVNYCDGSMIEACMDDWRKRKQKELELEMPENCRECMFKECLNRTTSVEVSRCIILHKIHVPGSYCPAEGRQANCPLKLVEGKEVEP